MTTTTPAPAPQQTEQAETKPALTEVVVAYITTAAPVAAGLTAPFLAADAATAAGIAYTAGAAFTALNYTDRIPANVMAQLPASDILQAHRTTLAISTITTGMSLGLGIFQGLPGMDALMAGALNPASIPGIVSLAWWTAVAFVPWKLSKIPVRSRTAKTRKHAAPTAPAIRTPATQADAIVRDWGLYISHPNGTHRGQILHTVAAGPHQWTGTITAPHGQPVTVTHDAVSSVYQIPTAWITFTEGSHAGERHITVNLTAPAELDPTTLAGAWRKWVSRPGGLMAGTHLADIQDDPNTGGQVAVVVAGDKLDRLRHPDRLDLAGALRTTPILISYEPRLDPREAVIRKMEVNPLQKGAAFPGTHVLKPNANGYIEIGPGVSGWPARIQLHDPALGGQHVTVAGVTGSGKGGALQIIALAHHVNESAIVYADPKGSSNPTIVKMAAYYGLGEEAAMGALRIWYLGLQERIASSAALGMKNFQASPDRPWAPLILDEASTLLTSPTHKKEAVHIIKAGATKGRNLGMPVVLANQILQLAELGSESAIRDNMIYGGSLILLRSDSSQKTLVDLPENFAACNPADIPPAWSGERALIYDPNTPADDPERTFGLCFAASPGAHAEMARTWILEDATPYIDPSAVRIPTDWTFWDDRHALATQSVLEDGEGDEDDMLSFEGPASSSLPSLTSLTVKEPTAEEKILSVLEENADPAGVEVIYLHKDDIARMTALPQTTLDSTLTRMVKKDLIHRQPGTGAAVRGRYGHGPTPGV